LNARSGSIFRGFTGLQADFLKKKRRILSKHVLLISTIFSYSRCFSYSTGISMIANQRKYLQFNDILRYINYYKVSGQSSSHIICILPWVHMPSRLFSTVLLKYHPERAIAPRISDKGKACAMALSWDLNRFKAMR